MALRGQPYFPLYVQDFMTDEKLNECSAESAGVYIRIMCVMHKSERYGTILLKQKDKQNESKIKNFACKLFKQMPYQVDVIERALQELVEEEVLTIDGDVLLQKRMVKDGILSDTRALSGSKGGKRTREDEFCLSKTSSKIEANTQAKREANAEYEYEDESVTKPTTKKGVKGETKHKYGRYNNVLLTDTQLAQLKQEFPDWEKWIETLSNGIESKGYVYKNHLATIRNWARKDNDGRTGKPGGTDKPTSQFAKYSNPI